MSVLVDTNVVLRRLQAGHPQQAAAIAAVDRLLRTGEPAYVTLQNLTEAWLVMTAPAGSNGFGFTIAAATSALDQIAELLEVLIEDTLAVVSEWRRLIERHQVSGRTVFDARLAATIRAHKIDRILTFNASDFARYGVTVLDPASAP